jgi:hypothetical protein
MTKFTVLADHEGVQWVAAELSPTRAAAIVKSYARAGIDLLERGEL